MREHLKFVKSLDHKAIEAAIERAEKNCSGEVRVHVQPRATGGDLQSCAERTFERLGMTKTELRNGVLLFIASEEHRFVILGDKGIDEQVGHDFWEDVAHELEAAFKAGDFTGGIVRAIERCGEKLSVCFPWKKGDVNELSNTISVQGHRDE